MLEIDTSQPFITESRGRRSCQCPAITTLPPSSCGSLRTGRNAPISCQAFSLCDPTQQRAVKKLDIHIGCPVVVVVGEVCSKWWLVFATWDLTTVVGRVLWCLPHLDYLPPSWLWLFHFPSAYRNHGFSNQIISEERAYVILVLTWCMG